MADNEDPNSKKDDQDDQDELHRLHRMSRTAGLGETDYVAVNGIAVAALIFGIGSALVIFDEIFLLLPVVALVLGIMGLRQIKRSNGTQTGKGLSWAAILFAIVLPSLLGSQSIAEAIRHRRDETAIAAQVRSFGEDVAARRYDAAYARMSENFRARVPEKEFADKFEEIQNAVEFAGPFKSMDWSGRAMFDVDNRTDAPLARTLALIGFNSGRVERLEIGLRKRGSEWFMDDIPSMFPVEPQVRQMPKPRK